jgi:hypothetical protein
MTMSTLLSFFSSSTEFLVASIEQSTQEWMDGFLPKFDPMEVKTYSIERLYQEDVTVISQVEVEKLTNVREILFKMNPEHKLSDISPELAEHWTIHSGSIRSRNLEHDACSGDLFKFCIGSPSAGNPAAHFLRVPKGKELKSIVEAEGFNEIEIIEESLIALVPEEKLKKKREKSQCYNFVVKSKKLDLLTAQETIETLKSYGVDKQLKIAHQVMRLVCKSGLGDVTLANFGINRETGNLVFFDTEPLHDSLLLDEEETKKFQYMETDRKRKKANSSHCAQTGLKNLANSCKEEYPLFAKVAGVYLSHFSEA